MTLDNFIFPTINIGLYNYIINIQSWYVFICSMSDIKNLLHINPNELYYRGYDFNKRNIPDILTSFGS